MASIIECSKRANKPLGSRQSALPMDTCNLRRVTNALPVSWEGIGYLMERDRDIERERGREGQRNSHLIDEM
ncbi:hypothetical protein EVAR_40806_1 [Eumeta japonica]|uniref:Uncharacterized protein n=1 Tax=Eumeta variegata TaxID=151549 RepID=A0A4C1X2J7_EUMVA|nr:hypothetical protein EVAR_40806_1 [Eumeta japonica]